MSTSVDRVRDVLLQQVRREFKRPTLSTSDPLMEGVIDSLGLFNLVGFIEATFQVVFDDADLTVENFATIETITGMVHGRLAAKSAPR